MGRKITVSLSAPMLDLHATYEDTEEWEHQAVVTAGTLQIDRYRIGPLNTVVPALDGWVVMFAPGTWRKVTRD